MNKYIKKNKNSFVEFTYFFNKRFPKDIPISTPLTFAFAGENLILTKKENGWWDILGGKIEGGESWIDALKRESKEEAGVVVDFIEVVGYILAENHGDKDETHFQKKTIMPITISFIQSVDRNWIPRETLEREIFNQKESLKILQERNDDNQLFEIAKDVFKYFRNQRYQYSFKYFPAPLNSNFDLMLTTQSMTFVYSGKSKKHFYIVKDFGENFYSLLGGGCFLDENNIECTKREIMEEAQFEVKDLVLLGVVLVEVEKGNLILSRTKQMRYLAQAKNVVNFQNDPREEIEERMLVDFDSLQKKVKLLQNQTGDSILKNLKKRL